MASGNRGRLDEGDNTQLIRFSEEHDEDDAMKLSVLSLTILIVVSVAIFLVLGFIILYKLQRKNIIFKNNSSCNHQPMNLVSSSTNKFQRVLNRVGRSFNENHGKCEDHHSSSSSSNKNT